MSGGMDLALLRQLVGGVVATLPDHYTHRGLGEACERLGLPEPPDEDGHSKRERVDGSFAALLDADLPRVAERILASDKPPQLTAAARNAIQDVLWAGQDVIEIPKRTRRELARDLDLNDLAIKPDRFIALLDRLWVLGSPLDPWTDVLRACAGGSTGTCSATRATGPPRNYSSSSAHSRRATRGSPGSWKGWPPPTLSLTSHPSGASPPPSTGTCALPGPSCGRMGPTAATRSSSSSRPGRDVSGSRRT